MDFRRRSATSPTRDTLAIGDPRRVFKDGSARFVAETIDGACLTETARAAAGKRRKRGSPAV
jgi:hypothetical protein